MANTGFTNYRSGLGNSAAYQVSGMPFVSGTISCDAAASHIRVGFPRVTSWVTFTNLDNSGKNLQVAFSQNGLTNQTAVFEIPPSASMAPLNLKVTEVWLSGSSNCSVIAGLTGIEVRDINNESLSPSGSNYNWSGSVTARVG
jgi:hypothetical protein